MGLLDFLGLKAPERTPPPALDHSQMSGFPPGVPPTYVFTERKEGIASGNPTTIAAPWDNYDIFYDLNIGWQDAPDPIRASDFYAAGNKIHPEAQMQIVTNLALGSYSSNSSGEFQVGKLRGYFFRPMYAGSQQPSVPRSNIQEGIPTTYGSQFQVPAQPMAGSLSASGFALPPESNDGHPY